MTDVNLKYLPAVSDAFANNEETLITEGGQEKNNDPEASIPVTLMVVKKMQGKPSGRILRVLLDSGGSHTMISIKALPLGAHPKSLGRIETCKTLAGTFDTSKVVELETIVFPEFSRNKSLRKQMAKVYEASCNYDVIIGRDVLLEMGLIIDFDKRECRWMEHTIPMKSKEYFKGQNYMLQYE